MTGADSLISIFDIETQNIINELKYDELLYKCCFYNKITQIAVRGFPNTATIFNIKTFDKIYEFKSNAH